MNEQFLTQDRLASIAHSHSSKNSPYSADVVPSCANLDRDDYRSFVVERRSPVAHASEKVLAKWLVERKTKLVAA